MSTRWERVVGTAHEIDRAFADGTVPDRALVLALASAVLDFQRSLAGPMIVKTKPMNANSLDAAAQ